MNDSSSVDVQEDQINITDDVESRLRKAATELARWKLTGAAKWAAEALWGMQRDKIYVTSSSPTEKGSSTKSPTKIRVRRPPYIDSALCFQNDSEIDQDLYLFVSTLFDSNEFDRCAYHLENATHPNFVFLKLYCKYLSWDKKNQEGTESVLTTGKIPAAWGNSKNDDAMTELQEFYPSSMGPSTEFATNNLKQDFPGDGQSTNITILRELDEYLDSNQFKSNKDCEDLGLALLYYLKGLLLKHDSHTSNAMSSFLKSISYYAFNHSCWTELVDCISRSDEANLLLKYINEKLTLRPPSYLKKDSQCDTHLNIMINFTRLAIFQEFSGNIEEFMNDLETLTFVFPNFSYLKAQNAIINYNYMDYINSETIFDQIVKVDPFRLDDLDTYSNILYVMQKHSKLAYLAQFSSQVDRFRPETCVIVANYYSARQEHEKAVMYFRRALTLNKRATNAWTLMGHEFVELKNSHAAIECYRRAVDTNSRDFKAWYGLGQAYEMLDMHLYSLYYFQNACTLKPLDRRMWQALGSCYAKIGNKQESIKCLERALQLSNSMDQDTVLLFKLAELYEEVDDILQCRNLMLKCIEIGDNHEGWVTNEAIRSRLWLARYELRNKNYEVAYAHATAISNGTAHEVEEARNIARECRRRIN